MDVDRKYDDRHKRSSRKRSTSRERSTRRQSFSSADSDEHGRRKRSSEPLDRNKSKKHKKSSSSKKSRETSKERLERKAIRSSEKKLLKKEMEDQNLSMIAAGMSAELGYTNLENPFGDNNLHQKFVWVKKREADTKKGITAAERSAAEEQRRREAVSELEKLSKRRAEREIEQQLREQEQLRMQQERDAMEVGDWISKEDDFHLEQAKLRAQIRVKEGRAKPIDVLAINLSIGTDSQLAKEFDALGLEMDMNEPYLIFKSLTMKETEELHHDIMLYLGLEKSCTKQAVLGSNDAMLAEVAGVDETDLIAEAFVKEAARDMDADESVFKDEAAVATASYLWQDKYRPRKPRYFNRVHTGYEWNKYNQTHYDHDNPPPKVVQGYKFNVFYPDLIDKTKAPTYKIEKDVGSEDTVVIRFIAGPPYEDVAFKIVKREWEYSHKKGFRSSFDRGILQLWFHFKRHFYRR
ncbi:hypothetical protein BATDEDRAFT_87661 [Batrachochytrium dendrobatidis JAM81]|uniref:Splicing factor Cactin n=1 Tax=Batrachochytrium dendrobatidis (strain JAM81 / FGSC 10211) TaxID=684364 RepID=F4P0L1_BATDJ|nr:uncharacterized protein BATDEDRAFT_87661 [Batrachochytrium dendrobatidis JAM81]EGF81611.1 hypothetical protein BATDEDRAFT_87661 [Batrachochytrium dendrobatidis JAM81]|eukprot:XP_006678261.1 hypothetical protein BATDEDRAFT_87661 [Batrachochytrium dendrobatidis JAM81]